MHNNIKRRKPSIKLMRVQEKRTVNTLKSLKQFIIKKLSRKKEEEKNTTTIIINHDFMH